MKKSTKPYTSHGQNLAHLAFLISRQLPAGCLFFSDNVLFAATFDLAEVFQVNNIVTCGIIKNLLHLSLKLSNQY